MITISAGLLRDGHPEKVGDAIWLYLWIINSTTKIDSRGIGKVFGGKPVKHEHVKKGLDIDRRKYYRHLERLREAGYIETKRTPFGAVITVMKAKKFYGMKVEDYSSSSDKIDTSYCKGCDKNVTKVCQKCHLGVTKSVLTKKTIQKTIHKDNTIKEQKVKPEEIGNSLITNQLKPKQKRDGNLDEVIELFQDRFNLKMKRVAYQRIAASNLIKRYEKSNVFKAIDAAAIVRDEPYSPQILSLEDLWAKWDKLAAFYKRNQPKSTNMNLDEIV